MTHWDSVVHRVKVNDFKMRISSWWKYFSASFVRIRDSDIFSFCTLIGVTNDEGIFPGSRRHHWRKQIGKESADGHRVKNIRRHSDFSNSRSTRQYWREQANLRSFPFYPHPFKAIPFAIGISTMVTVITTKEELSTPAHNGVVDTGFSDNERLIQYIKDFQEVISPKTPSEHRHPDVSFRWISIEQRHSNLYLKI